KAGARYVEVNARGRLVRGVAGHLRQAPAPGADVRLTLDLDLQRYIHQVWPRDKRGAVVAMVPSTGEILAMYSAPNYDPNLLVGGIPRAVWQQLNTDPGRPLLNRATNGTYPPGSTWKLATALIGLERGAITPTQVMPIPCTGGMSYAGRYSRCWFREGHGPQNLLQAIQNSCNVYFYQLGIMLGLDVLSREGTRLGFSRRTGVDLPSEKTGTFPTGKDWYVKRFGWRPAPSEVMNVAIGQGPNDQTPLRMAQFFSALAGNGTSRTPHLLMRPDAPVETDLRVAPATLAAVRDGMARVIEEGGTAHAVQLRNWQLMGKTGTSQNSADPKKPHAWFTGFAGPRGQAPEVVVAVIVEFGESGSGAAAPIAAQVADFYLNRKHGRPTPPLLSAESARVGAMIGTGGTRSSMNAVDSAQASRE
ncbi:MAG TPA: penicillin-binding transpeptidase domain-containing protein, partial [Longimicrobium sp.]|nr:penicillin-binding transpeptidase domain-containing protein [Longimicrobium sp.]